MPEAHSKPLRCDTQKLLRLRQSAGWTQQEAGSKSGYTDRLIRKIEAGGSVKPSTLINVLRCYHEATETTNWKMADFLLPIVTEPNNGSVKQTPEELAEQKRQISTLRRHFDTVFNQRKTSQMADYIAKDVQFSHGEGEPQCGIEVIEQLATNLLTSFDPINMVVEQLFWWDGAILSVWHGSMKHTAEFGGVPATNKWVNFHGNSRCQFKDGMIVEVQDNWDVYDVIRQLKGEPKQWF